MNKVSKVILSIVFLIVIVLVGIFWTQDKSINWENEEDVFAIQIPEDFDEYQIEKLNEKIKVSKELFQIKKDDNWTWVVMGNAFGFAYDYDRARYAYEKSLEMEPNDKVSMLNLAKLYEKQFIDYTKAIDYYQMALGVNGDNIQVYIDLANLYINKLEDLDTAELIYMEALEKHPSAKELEIALIRLYEKKENMEKIIEFGNELLEKYPDDIQIQRKMDKYIK
jgi:tetratricopeptide (TPR) repeat protein